MTGGCLYPVHVRYRYVPASGREDPILPPLPPDGWPVPRLGDTVLVPGGDPLRVVGVAWDYSRPSVTVSVQPGVVQ